jgi:hypothetical protein
LYGCLDLGELPNKKPAGKPSTKPLDPKLLAEVNGKLQVMVTELSTKNYELEERIKQLEISTRNPDDGI